MEFRFEASDTEDAADELRSLLSWLSDEQGFGQLVRISPEHESTATGEMSDLAPDVTSRPSLHHEWSTLIVDRKLVFDLGDCPPGSPGVVDSAGPQANPLLGNVEGMAVGEPLKTGPHEGRRPLYLVSDDNGSREQITRFYGLVVDLD